MKKKLTLEIISFFVVCWSVILFSGCMQQQKTIEQPSYSINSGIYSTPQKITINKPEGDGVEVYYTLNGSEPTEKSNAYQNPIVIQQTATIKSIAIDKKGNRSQIKESQYIIETVEQPQNTVKPPSSSNPDGVGTFDAGIQGAWGVFRGREPYMISFNNGYATSVTFSSKGDEIPSSPTGEYEISNVSSDGTAGDVTINGEVLHIDFGTPNDNAIEINGEKYIDKDSFLINVYS